MTLRGGLAKSMEFDPVAKRGLPCWALTGLLLCGLAQTVLSQPAETGDAPPASVPNPTGRSADAAHSAPLPAIEDLLREARRAFDDFDATTSARTRRAARTKLTELVESISSRAPDNPRLPLFRARILAWDGKVGEAQTVIRHHARTDEGANDWRTHRLAADLLVNEFPQLAHTSYTRALQLHPEEPTVLVGLSRCAERLGRRDQAVEWAEKAVKLRPTAGALGQLARAQAFAKRWDEASASASSAVSLAREAMRAEPDEREPLEMLDRLLALSMEIVQQRIQRSQSGASPEDYLLLADFMASQGDNARILREHDIQAMLGAAVAAVGPAKSAALVRAYFESSMRIAKCDDARRAIAHFTEAGGGREQVADWDTRWRARCGDEPPVPSGKSGSP